LYGLKSEDSPGGQERYLTHLNKFKIAKIEETECTSQETKVLVNFIGDPTHAEVPISKIEKFDRKYEEFSKTKKKNLINAINIASKTCKEEIYSNDIVNSGNFQKPEKVKIFETIFRKF
jgi:hypothetical protein